jgi:hypothetical protein
MSDRAYAKAQAPQKTLTGSSPSSYLLQRTCACGGSSGIDGLCAECRDKRLTLSHSRRGFEAPPALAVAQGNSSAQESVTSLDSVMDRASRFGHDFSRIPVYSSSQQPMLQTGSPSFRGKSQKEPEHIQPEEPGNSINFQAVSPQRMETLQAKLMVNQPGDIYEQEADQVAEQVMRMPELASSHSNALHRQSMEDEEDEKLYRRPMEDKEENEENLQARESPRLTPQVTPELQARINALRSGGQPLSGFIRPFMESRFWRDFSQVRIHTDAQAAETAQEINARAYTVGRDIVFGIGQYIPETTTGKGLIAHELTHVVQQNPNQLSLYQTPSMFNQSGMASASQSNRYLNRDLFLQRRDIPHRKQEQENIPRDDKPPVSIGIDTKTFVDDKSKGMDQITEDFYYIPVELIPPKTTIPGPPLLTIGKGGCSIRKDGLTTDDFSLSLKDWKIKHTIRRFLGSNGLFTVHCWANNVQFNMRLQQTIFIPKDLATHPCKQGLKASEERKRILDHEHLHEGDNNKAVKQIKQNLQQRLMGTVGIGSLMSMVRITDDPTAFVEECSLKIQKSLEELRSEHEYMYHELSTEYAIQRDPHDQELHELKLRLLKEARDRK